MLVKTISVHINISVIVCHFYRTTNWPSTTKFLHTKVHWRYIFG